MCCYSQVMADAANEALDVILANCCVKGIIPFLLSSVISDKNKIHRTQCARLIVLILEVT